MKYLAILRDSFRESIDSKVLYVTIGLSILLIVLLASVTFRPLTVKEQLDGLCDQSNYIFSFQPTKLRFDIADFHGEVEDPARPWRGDYRFTFRITFPDEVTAGMLRQQLGRDMQGGMYSILWWAKNVDVKEETTDNRQEVRLAVTSQGSTIDDIRSWGHEPSLFFGALPLSWFRTTLSYAVYWIENRLVNTIGGWIAVLLGVVVTASFIPNMLRKGTADMLLTKPIHRSSLLLFKYVGGLTFLFLNAAVIIVGLWLVLGLRTGIWAYGFLLTTLVLTFFFAILYSVSTLFAVLTRSTVVCILMTCAAWLVLWLVGLLHGIVNPTQAAQTATPRSVERVRTLDDTRDSSSPRSYPQWAKTTVATLHAILPRTSDLGTLTTRLLSREVLSESERREHGLETESKLRWGESLGVSGAFIAVMLGLACWRFSRQDY